MELIGGTPVLKLARAIPKNYNIYAKAEFLNPSGSIKDIMAHYMMKKAEERGELRPGMTILEVTSGNTGISFAMLASLKNYRFMAVMPEHMSRERISMMKAYGAEVILTPKKLDMQGAIDKYNRIKAALKDVWLPRQFENKDNIGAHKKITGKEIIKQVPKIDFIVAGIGTGGTLFGVAEAVKKINQDVRIVGVEPAESAVLNGKKPGIHNIQGIGEGFVPPLVNKDKLDYVIGIKTKDAEEMTRRIIKEEAMPVGISSGANLLAAIEIADKFGKEKHIVTIFPDRAERYLSTNLFR